MARFGKRRVGVALAVALIVVLAGGYFAQRLLRAKAADAGGTTALSDSTADTTKAASAQEPAGGKDKKKGKNAKKEPDPVPVEVATVQPREISTYYYTTATLDPERSVSVLAKAAGQITSLAVEEGATVSQGAMLCRIDDREARISLDEARINLEKQEAEFARIRKMFDEQLISDREFSDARYQHEVAKNQYDSALLRYEYTKVPAPFAGVVTRRYVEVGQNVAVGAQLFEVADTDPLLVRVYMPEAELGGVEIGRLVTIEPDNDPATKLTGRVVRIAPEVDGRTGTVKVTVETKGGAMPGSFARVKIVTDTRQGTLSVPRRGLLSDAGDFFVYVAEADSVRKASVRVGYQNEEYAEVVDGVREGEKVAVIGVGALRTGTKVKIVDPVMQRRLSGKGAEADSAAAKDDSTRTEGTP